MHFILVHTSFPVGKIDFLELYPLDFLEFMGALNNESLVELLKNRDLELIKSFKGKYTDLLKQLQDNPEDYEEWILFVLSGIEETSIETLKLVKEIVSEINNYGEDLKQRLPNLYSKQLIELLFYEFYTKTQYIEEGMRVTRKTAVSYLNQLENNGFLSSQKIGRENLLQRQVVQSCEGCQRIMISNLNLKHS